MSAIARGRLGGQLPEGSSPGPLAILLWSGCTGQIGRIRHRRSGRRRGGHDGVAAGSGGGSVVPTGGSWGRNHAPLGLHAGEPGSFAGAPADPARVQHHRQPPARRYHQARRPVRVGDRAVRLSQRRRQHAAEPGRRRRFRARGDGAGQDRDRRGESEELARLRPERDRRAGHLRDELHSQLRGARVPTHPGRRAGRRLSGALHEPQGGRVRGRDRARRPRDVCSRRIFSIDSSSAEPTRAAPLS